MIAIIAVLAALLLPALGKAKGLAQGAVCANNLKQFAYAWLMYVEDHNEWFPPNKPYQSRLGTGDQVWVKGWLEPMWPPGRPLKNLPDNTNTVYLKESLLAPYLRKSVGVWRCPGDKSVSLHGGKIYPRVRSYSMNSHLGKPMDTRPQIRYKFNTKMSNLRQPPPSRTWTFIDEREDSIEDCAFGVDIGNGPFNFINIPAAYHNGGGNLSFADGHVERRKWTDPHIAPLIKGQFVNVIWRPGPVSPDVLWLMERTTGLKDRL